MDRMITITVGASRKSIGEHGRCHLVSGVFFVGCGIWVGI